MRRNNIAFVWLDGQEKDRFLQDVRKGDYIALADGYQIVAIGKATCDSKYLHEFKNFIVSRKDYQGFSQDDGYNHIVATKINIVDINDQDKPSFYYEKMSRFCSILKLRNKIADYYESNVNSFDIKSYTGTIKQSNGESHVLLNSNVSYIVPVYQRPYEWNENQVVPFINDILSSYMGKDGSSNNPEPMFIGTMQLSKRRPISSSEYQHEVVDGQQRITTITILLKELKSLYPTCRRLNEMQFNWLETHVSEQQSVYLHNYLEGITDDDHNNPYSRNALFIRNTLERFRSDREEGQPEFDIEKFCDYLFSHVIFVVIETSAGLSKTIQIFNTINNTGLDLNGSDLFKIRMYEYMRDIENEDENVFEKIQELYTLVDVLNERYKVNFTMGTMLDLYKNILITEYNLNAVLFAFSWGTFFERLFDSLLGINEWDHFKNLNGLRLSLDTLHSIIEMRYVKHAHRYANIETEFASRMISDYSRYRWSKGLVIYPFLHFYRNEQDVYDKLERLIVVLNKYFFIYSLAYSKQINPVNSYIASLVKSMKTASSEDIILSLKKKIESVDDEWLMGEITKDLIDGSKWWRYLVCGVSTYLTERSCFTSAEEMIDKIFHKWEFDIEHIHATADPSNIIPTYLQNSIGNLTPLEYEINRSIQDQVFEEKRKSYTKSKFLTIRQIAETSKWDIECIKKRRDAEGERVYDYIKKEPELSFKSKYSQ